MKGKSVVVYAGILFLIVLMIGCQTTKAVPHGYFDYDQNQAQQAANQLDFDLDLPEFIPFEMVMMVSDIYTIDGAEALDLSFYTDENDLLTLQFIEGNVEPDLFSPEQVAITDSLSGQYVDNSFAKSVTWQKDGVTYKMTYRPSNFADNNNDVEKSDLLDVARSFHF
ncbi:hypothetical protein SAMN05421743_12084 [Thalassobacillus cyri]|uniref:DUF4367 domain-containing protein n=1 Tax=Thalassobacillus cyri TaxID=571932 RepID=A0A1H4GZS1_9BACI|nr:hypothetical protein [Thalassobacillus cyri]SEB15089.1 hypothetical protein SAMN05421743_12084 [Thalassobacillus cyri]